MQDQGGGAFVFVSPGISEALIALVVLVVVAVVAWKVGKLVWAAFSN